MSFQIVIDNAQSISIIRRPIISQTVSRSNTVRSVSRGGNLWRFEVKLPDGPRWTESRTAISLIEALDKIETDVIQFNNSGHDWLFGYMGDLTNISAITVNVPSSGNTVTITGGATLASGYRFLAGDIIQLGSTGKCYTIVEDVAFNENTITLHRPLIDETSGSKTLRVGPNCQWIVQCIQFPNWTLFARDQVSWDGSFIFQEVL
jgi:hypothetical protein